MKTYTAFCWSLVLTGLVASSPAVAAVDADASVIIGLLDYGADSDSPPGTEIEWERANAFQTQFFQDGGTSNWGTGPMCGGPFTSLACGNGPTVGYPTEAQAAAQANGTNGNLKVRAEAHSGQNARAIASAQISDTITFATSDRTVKLRLDIDQLSLFGGPNAPDFSLSNDLAELSLIVSNGPIEGQDISPVLARFHAFADIDFCSSDPCGTEGLLKGFEFYRGGGANEVLVDSGTNIPNVFEFEVDFAPCFLSICSDEDTFDIEVRLQANARASGSNVNSVVTADNTTFLQIDAPYTSLNGYAYAGAPVPLPAGIWLLLSAIAPAWSLRRRHG